MSEITYSDDNHESVSSSDGLLEQETLFADPPDNENTKDRAVPPELPAHGPGRTLRGGVDEILQGIDRHVRVDPLFAETTISEDQSVVNNAMPGVLAPSELDDSIGRVGIYEVQQVLGRGGMGIVLRALDTRLNRVVAVKVLASHLAAHDKARVRFLREAQAAAAISHPNVVTIHAVEESNSVPYLVMECVEGETLTRKIHRDGHLKTVEILRIGLQIARGLAAAHAQRLIHRDVKPCNILLEADGGNVKITDFGLARAADDLTATRTGEVSGTPQFMSPEQADGLATDHRSDLFSLGTVLYVMCTGCSPFRAETSRAVLRKVCELEPQPIHELNPDIPSRLTQIVRKLLEKKPGNRIQSADELAALLEQHLAFLQAPTQLPEPDDIGLFPPEPDDSADDSLIPAQVASSEFSSSSRWLPFVGILLLLAIGPAIAEFAGISLFPNSRNANEADESHAVRGAESNGTPAAARLLPSADWNWTIPVGLEANGNESARDDAPTVSADGLSLIFPSDRLGGFGAHDLWMSHRNTATESWPTARNLGPKVNSAHSESAPFLSRDGLTLLFASSHPGGKGGLDLWMCTRASGDSAWSEAAPLSAAINTAASETEPCLSSDGLLLLFSRNTLQSPESSDLWMSRRRSTSAAWSPAVRLSAAVNTPASEGGPYLASDGRTLLYHSGNEPSIWMSERDAATGEWKRGEEIFKAPPGGASHPSLSDDGRQLRYRSTTPRGQTRLFMVERVRATATPAAE